MRRQKCSILVIFLLVINFALHTNLAFASLGKLSNVLQTGYSDGWNGKLTAGEYWLENANQQGAIRYYYANYDGQSNQRVISTKISLKTSDQYAEAGLLYGFDNAARRYFLVNIRANNTFSVTYRDSNGFTPVFQTSLDINPAVFNTLAVRENGNQLSFYVNNVSVGDITHPAAGSGSVGIVAVGTGSFGFTDFVETTSQQASGDNGTSTIQNKPTSTANKYPLDEPQSTHAIRDEFGFENPMEALTIDMPESWDVKGAVQWYGKPSCAMDVGIPKVHLKGTARNGMQWIELIPGGIWAWNSNFDAMPQMRTAEITGCDAKRILDIQAFVSEYIPVIRPAAKVNYVRPRADIVQKFMQEQAQEIDKFRQQNPNARLRPEAVEISLTYSANGRQVNELMETSVVFADLPILDPYGGMSAMITMALAQGTFLTATVEGQADAKLLKTVGDSIEQNPQYMARLQQFYEQRARQMFQANQRQIAANRAFRKSMASSGTANTYSDILDSNMASWKRIQGMKDAGQNKLVDATLERAPWQTSYGETVYMPQQYQRVFQLPNGVFAGTNDNFFNPVDGAQLKPRQY